MRQGFRLVTLGGESIVLAHVGLNSPFRVGKYRVDVASLERTGVPALYDAAERSDLVVVDEIGRMEILSARFREAVGRLIAGGKRLLGTIMLSPEAWADGIKRQPQVRVLTLTRARYREVLAEVRGWVETPAQ